MATTQQYLDGTLLAISRCGLSVPHVHGRLSLPGCAAGAPAAVFGWALGYPLALMP
jgi:hypothetical protein